MNLESKYWHLMHFRLARRLSRNERIDMCQIMVMNHYRKGDDITLGKKQVSDNVYFLKSGTVKITTYSNEGEVIIKDIIKKGDIFGFLMPLNLENEEDYVTAIEDATICVIDSEYFKKMIENNKRLNNYILKLAGVRIKKLERKVSSLLYKDAKTRIKDFIIDYIKDFGVENDECYFAKNLLSNNDIGKLTSTSRQTVNQALNELKQKNIIDFDKDTIRFNKDCLKLQAQ